MWAIQKSRIFKSTESLKAPWKQNWSSVAFSPSLLALTPNTLNLNVHKFQIYAFKITGFLNCSPGAAVKKKAVHCSVCVSTVCVCVCVHYSLLCVCTWVGEMLSTNSEYGLPYLATCYVTCGKKKKKKILMTQPALHSFLSNQMAF